MKKVRSRLMNVRSIFIVSCAVFFLSAVVLESRDVISQLETAITEPENETNDSIPSLVLQLFEELIITLGPELGGIAFGVVTLDILNERRQRKTESFRRNRQLLREFASAVPVVAVKAAEDLMELGLLGSGLLSGKDFSGANLQGAKLIKADCRDSIFLKATLSQANFERAHLENVDFTSANLYEAILQKCHLENADLRGANLENANLQAIQARKAYLSQANLRGANLFGANLEGAFLNGAHLEGANLEMSFLLEVSLENATYDDETKWPDRFNPNDFGAIGPSSDDNEDGDDDDE